MQTETMKTIQRVTIKAQYEGRLKIRLKYLEPHITNLQKWGSKLSYMCSLRAGVLTTLEDLPIEHVSIRFLMSNYGDDNVTGRWHNLQAAVLVVTLSVRIDDTLELITAFAHVGDKAIFPTTVENIARASSLVDKYPLLVMELVQRAKLKVTVDFDHPAIVRLLPDDESLLSAATYELHGITDDIAPLICLDLRQALSSTHPISATNVLFIQQEIVEIDR